MRATTPWTGTRAATNEILAVVQVDSGSLLEESDFTVSMEKQRRASPRRLIWVGATGHAVR